MYKEIIFRDATRKFGGKFQLEDNFFSKFLGSSLETGGLDTIKKLRQENNELPDVYIDFIENKSLNACAFKEEGLYFIGINYETLYKFYLFFNYILSFPKILSFIGNNKKEIEPKKIDFKKPVVPIDDQRKSYAYTLALSATQFLVCHEYAHIINGHLDFNRKTDSQFIFEMTSNKEKEGLLSQTLEFDADSFASQIGINSNIIRFKNKKRIHRDFRPAFKSLEDTLFAWTFSVYTIFRFFGKNTNFDFNKLDKYSHPYPDIRQEYCFVHIPNLIRESEYSESYNLSRSIKAMEEFENAANLIKKGPRTWNFMYMPHPAPIKFVYTKKGWNHLYKILNNWNHVRPLLKPYTEITLSPVVCGDEEEFMKIPKEFYKFN